MRKKQFILYFILIILGLNLSSCLTRKNKELLYFKSLSTNTVSDVTPYPKENIIKSSDLLQVSIFCLDEETFKIFNASAANTSGGSAGIAGAGNVGYLVDDSGNIKLPLLGSVKASGLNKIQLADTIAKQLTNRQFAINPIVSVRITNFKITILGEVAKPGLIIVPNEHITIIEALAMAGDLTIYSSRDNILLIREKDGKRITRRFSLNSNEIFTTDIYYLQNQDLIYVESTKNKATPLSRVSQNLSLIITTFSFLLLIYSTSRTIK
ncbi:MAG: polysaccharide biosynthesis/export family protein [bacterium]|nr:polysaccharide biosynthesis/export family protein [bacterium]